MRNLNSQILQAVASVKNETIAQAIGHDTTHVSRIHSGERGIKLSELESYLEVLGMRVIKIDTDEIVSIPKQKYEALRLLARESLS